MAQDTFLPEDYKPKSTGSNYMKLEQGENKFRALDKPIIGYELWIDKKPKRFRISENIPQELVSKAAEQMPEDRLNPTKEFWAMPVYNYKTETVQILQVTQQGIMRDILTYTSDGDYGSPLGYDLKIVRTGEGLETRYQVIASPPKPIDEGITKMYKDMGIKLEELYRGGDPFNPSDDVEADDIPF